MESISHRRLKHLSLAFLRERGCRAVALEVASPIARYCVDVAGYFEIEGGVSTHLDRPVPDRGGFRALRAPGPARRPREPRTILIECKQSRSDFLRDRRDREKLLGEREVLEHRRRDLEQTHLRAIEPHLRRAGTSLFPALEEWDFAASRMPAYRQIVRRLQRLDALIHGQTKFCMIARYALADRLYIAAPAGMISPHEVPPGWGLLECPRRAMRKGDVNADLFGDSVLAIRKRSPEHFPRNTHRQRLLRNIAVAASTAMAGALGVMA